MEEQLKEHFAMDFWYMGSCVEFILDGLKISKTVTSANSF